MPSLTVILVYTKVSRSTKKMVSTVRQKYNSVSITESPFDLQISHQFSHTLLYSAMLYAYIYVCELVIIICFLHQYPQVIMPVLDSIDAIVTSCKSTLEELWELERGHAPSGDGHTPLDRMQLYQTLQVHIPGSFMF